MRLCKALLVAAAMALALPAVAPAADEAIPPPGNSAIDQYKETLPAPGGGRPTDKGRNRSPEKVIGAKKTKKLEQYGEDGAAVVDLVAETAPGAAAVTVTEQAARAAGKAKNAAGKAKGAAGKLRGLAGEIDNEPTSSALAEIAGQATGADGSGGIGWLLPLIVALTAVGAVAYGLGRRGARR